MNNTEAMEIVFAMATRCAELEGEEVVTRVQRTALAKWGVRVRMARSRLDRQRKARRVQQLQDASATEMVRSLKGLPRCKACGWESGLNINPLRMCSSAFGCAMECLRYRSSEWSPELNPKPKAS